MYYLLLINFTSFTFTIIIIINFINNRRLFSLVYICELLHNFKFIYILRNTNEKKNILSFIFVTLYIFSSISVRILHIVKNVLSNNIDSLFTFFNYTSLWLDLIIKNEKIFKIYQITVCIE